MAAAGDVDVCASPDKHKALLLSVWYDLSDGKLAEALDERTSFRRFCGFSDTEPMPERTAFVGFCKALMAAELDRALFKTVTLQLKAKAENRHHC